MNYEENNSDYIKNYFKHNINCHIGLSYLFQCKNCISKGIDKFLQAETIILQFHIVLVNGKQNKLTEELRPIFNDMCDELLENGTLLPNQNENLEEIE